MIKKIVIRSIISNTEIIIHKINSQLSYIVLIEKNPQTYLRIPLITNIIDNENLNGLFILILLTNIIIAIEIVITILLKQTLNIAYFDTKTPSIMLLSNKIKPIIKARFFMI